MLDAFVRKQVARSCIDEGQWLRARMLSWPLACYYCRQAAGVCMFGKTSSVCILHLNGCLQCDDAVLADLHAVLCRQGLFGMASQSPSECNRSSLHQHMHDQWRQLK